MELVLLRHAKAEKQSPGLPDETRNLTTKGFKTARAVAKGLSRYWAAGAKIEIWASQAQRSTQTAAILAETINAIKVKEYPAIYSGNLEELIAEWRVSKADIIVIVGHEPYLSIWSKQLAGATITFKKCAAAGFVFQSPKEATLNWFAGPKVLAAFGKENQGV